MLTNPTIQNDFALSHLKQITGEGACASAAAWEKIWIFFLGNKSEGGLIGLMRQNRPSKKRNVLFQTIGWRDSYILYKYVIYAININFLIYVPALSPMTLDWLPPVSTCDIPQEKRSQRSPPRVFSKTTVDFQSVDFIR